MGSEPQSGPRYRLRSRADSSDSSWDSRLSTHVLRTSETPMGLRILRNIDLIVLALALPIWLVAQLPFLGYAATTVAWLAARWFQAFMQRRALAKGERRAVLGARAAALIGRLYLVTIAVFVAGLIDRKAGVSGGVLAVVVFTSYFVSEIVSGVLEEDR